MLFIKFILRIPLRMSEDKLFIGDDAIHGEDAYAFEDASQAIRQVDYSVSANGNAELGAIQGQGQSNGSVETKVVA